MSLSGSKGAGKESVCSVQLSSSGTTKAIRFTPCRYFYCTARLKAHWHAIHLCPCRIKHLQQVKGILFKNRCCMLPSSSACWGTDPHAILFSIGGYCGCMGLRGEWVGEAWEFIAKKKSSRELWGVSACVCACTNLCITAKEKEAAR